MPSGLAGVDLFWHFGLAYPHQILDWLLNNSNGAALPSATGLEMAAAAGKVRL